MSEKDAGSPGAYRLFIAIPVPDHVKDAMESAQDTLRRALPPRCVRWTTRAQFHLTLAFLGDVDTQRLEALARAVCLAAEGSGVLRLRTWGLGCFPNLHRPRAIWTRVDDDSGRLPALQRTVQTASAGFASQRPDGRFTGHVTLGRAKGLRRPQAAILATLARSMENTSFGAWTANSLHIVRSELAPGGSRYATLMAIPLTAEPGPALQPG